ncbi:uncharacterized protein DS421_6g186680 [Arachis hypogaea]|nr:uncharacterized protein DS421_6g186680 [Arachis hypogaea]
MSTREDVMRHNLCQYVSLYGKCRSRDSLRMGTMVSEDPFAARLSDNSENSVPVKGVCLALDCDFLKGVQSFWSRWKI